MRFGFILRDRKSLDSKQTEIFGCAADLLNSHKICDS